jgi:hypothetical protein
VLTIQPLYSFFSLRLNIHHKPPRRFVCPKLWMKEHTLQPELQLDLPFGEVRRFELCYDRSRSASCDGTA